MLLRACSRCNSLLQHVHGFCPVLGNSALGISLGSIAVRGALLNQAFCLRSAVLQSSSACRQERTFLSLDRVYVSGLCHTSGDSPDAPWYVSASNRDAGGLLRPGKEVMASLYRSHDGIYMLPRARRLVPTPGLRVPPWLHLSCADPKCIASAWCSECVCAEKEYRGGWLHDCTGKQGHCPAPL